MNRISRRDFMRVTSAGLAVIGTSANIVAKAKKSDFTEALVIGSGFGGAVAALRLAEAGINTVVLERGRRWPIQSDGNTFATFMNPDGRSSWLSDMTTDLIPTPIDRYVGVLELINANGIAVRNGAGVGGGSLAYNAIMLQPRRELFEQVFPSNIKYDEMVSLYYPRVRQMLGQSTIPADILATPYYASTRANLEQAQAAGMYQGADVEFAIDWDIVRQEIAGTKVPSAIDGQSWFGLNSGAKISVDKNYLRMAEETGKVEILTQHVVTDIAESKNDGLYHVTVNEIADDGTPVRQREFACRHLFMAAGAVHTPSLLVRAREKGTLPRLNKWIGRDWGGNGDFIALRGGLGGFLPAQGGPCGHILMEDMANQFSPTNLVELVIPKNFHQFALGGAPGFSLYVGLGVAPALGYFTYDAATDAVTLNWPNLNPKLDQFSAGVNAMLDALNAANPGSFTAFNSEDPGYKASGGPALTAHPVGGATFGKAVDFHGRVHGHRGLYVVDGSLIPGGSVGGVNPSFTIAALAERVMDRVLHSD